MKLLLVLALVALAQGRPENGDKIDYRLLRAAKQAETADIFVTFQESTAETLQAIDDTRFDTREDRLDAMNSALVRLAGRVQSNVLSYLQGRFEFKSLWITNQVYVKGATMDLIMVLASFNEVKSLELEEIIELDTIVEGPILRGRQDPSGEWGVKKIQAAEARELLGSTTKASQIVVSTIDTGARHTHEALRANWLGDYGWFDPYDANALPMDINGHGTHTTGTICGAGGIGVYPDAKWTSCRGCATSSCAQNALLACAQFITCPTRPNGSAPDCSKAPHLVSNSWGGGRGATWFDGAIAAFHTANIIPLFSIGNSGPSCNTANSPGDRNVIGVGSTTVTDELSSFSSVGPTTDGRMKPDISAPGSNVLSAYNTADDAYRALSGTSMACPHAAGLTSLLLAYNPSISFGNVTAHMRGGVDQDLVDMGKVCSGVPDNQFPNHHHGEGRINAFKSLRRLIDASK
ncbi:bacillopeptidase F [Folsomia candida]|nr:bacillopeptidase F [Folsomia candida]